MGKKVEADEPNRFCTKEESWVCPHCGKHVDYDRYNFYDESCMLNAVKVKKKLLVYKDDDENQRVVEVIHEHPID